MRDTAYNIAAVQRGDILDRKLQRLLDLFRLELFYQSSIINLLQA